MQPHRPLPPLPYPVELKAPDIAPYRAGNTGIDYVHRFESGAPGPRVLVSALVHGNEICGAIALDSGRPSPPAPAPKKQNLGGGG